MVILWARAEGKSGWAQGGGGGLQEMEYVPVTKLFNPFGNSFFFLLENKQKRFFFHFEEFLETEEDRAVLNTKKLLQSSVLSKNLKYSFHSLPFNNQAKKEF